MLISVYRAYIMQDFKINVLKHETMLHFQDFELIKRLRLIHIKQMKT